MEISWYVVSFNSVYLSFLEVYKLLLILSQGCKLEPSLYQFSVGPHPPFRVSFWCVCVRGRGNMHVLSHPDTLTKSRMFSYCIPYALMCDDIRNDRADGSGTPERCLQVFPERCRHEEESQRQGHQTLGHVWWFFDEFLAFEIAIWKCRADHGIAIFTGVWWRIFRRYLRKDWDDWVTNGWASPSW